MTYAGRCLRSRARSERPPIFENLEFLQPKPPLDLNDPDWVVHTQTADRPPVHVAAGAHVLLEQPHVVAAAQKIRCGQAGYAGADNCDPFHLG